MQRIDDGIAAGPARFVARWQEDDGVAIDGISLEIALERRAVNGDPLDDRGPGPRDDVGHVGLDLRDSGERADRRGESWSQNGDASY